MFRVVTGFALLAASVALAAPRVDPTAEFVLAGFKDSRERLRSGEFRCTGTVVNDRQDIGRLEGPVEIYCAFDYDAGKVRFDRTEAERILKKGRSHIQGRDDWTLGTTGGKYVKTAERQIIWRAGAELVAMRPLSTRPPSEIQPFDVRLVGMSGLIDVLDNAQWSDNLGHILRRFTKAEVVRLPNGIVRLDLKESSGIDYFDFDEAAGYVPVAQGTRGLGGPGVTLAEPSNYSKTEWERKNGTWVPKRWFVNAGVKPNHVQNFDLTFTWLRVNEPIAPETFMTRGMGLPDGVEILSAETGKGHAVRLGKIGDLTPNPNLLAIEPATPKRPWWEWAGLVAGVLALLVGGYYVVRRVRRAKLA